MEPTREELVAQAFNQAPTYVQDFISSGKYRDFMEKARLLEDYHVDVMGKVSDEVLMMMLGVTTPTDLTENLKREAGLTEEQASDLIELANDEIFVPIRQNMQQPGEVVPVRAPLVPVPAPIETPAPIFQPQPPTVPTSAVQTAVPLPQTPALPVVVSAPVAYTEPTVRTMAHDVEAMKDGQVPAPLPYTLHTVNPLPTSTPVSTPAPTVPVAPAQPSIPPAQPAAIPVVAVPAETLPPHPTRTFGTPDIGEVTSTLQKYGIDPYRETPE